jgi:prepilin-type N-terminal cleavage/methylation domain-containing protein/prepilin-type processing-associated H-X9-DG protein
MRKKAFTLIELLVVVAIIALLLSILLPSLSGAREAAKAVVCGQHQRQFGTGIATYATESSDWIPGVNTTGVVLRAKKMQLSSNPAILFNPKTPVQEFDWLTPVLSSSQELPADPVQRFKFILEKYRCASQRYTAVAYQSDAAGVNMSRFEAVQPFTAISMLMPYHFQIASTTNDMGLGMTEGLASQPIETVRPPASGWEVSIRDYVPRLTRVGPAARKICVADGTRYLPDEESELDFDVSPVPSGHNFGSFTSQGAWWSGSREYGVRPGSVNWDGMTVNPSSTPGHKGAMIPISYRHGKPANAREAKANKGTINALFFDGHVSRLSDRESRDVHLWYPSGAIVNAPAEGMTRVEVNYVIP